MGARLARAEPFMPIYRVWFGDEKEGAVRRNSSDVTRREVLRRFGLAAGFAALGPGCVASRPSGPGAAIKVVVVTDLTGPIGFAGPLNANIAKLVVDDITAGGGLLGRPLNLIVVDSASDPAI